MAEPGAKTELKEHESTYAAFVSLFKIGTVVTAIVVAAVILLIAG